MAAQDDRYPELREAVRALCREYPDAYFRAVDERRGYPDEFVAALTARGLAGGHDSRRVRRAGAGAHRGVGDHGGDQPVRRQRGRVPRPDVQHGHAAARTDRTRRSGATCRPSRRASCGCSRWA